MLSLNYKAFFTNRYIKSDPACQSKRLFFIDIYNGEAMAGHCKVIAYCFFAILNGNSKLKFPIL